QSGTLLTVGKFNANFGAEQRNEWDRLTGTTSLLFGAQPQDLVGIMLTQPLGDGDVTLRPFVTTQFKGEAEFDGRPSGGLAVAYRPNENFGLEFANWIGPGFVSEGDEAEDEYTTVEYTENWYGPNLHADHGGTLYFADLNARWLPRPDVTLQA